MLENQSTFVMIKPDGVKRGLVGEIIGRFENAGMEILRIQRRVATEEQVREHYAHLAETYGEALLQQVVEWIAEWPVIAIVFYGRNAIQVARKLAGATDPLKTSPGTIRGDFGSDSIALSSSECRAVENLVHTAETVEDAEREMKIWFR